MHHRTLCKNSTIVLTEQDKKEVCLILKEMIKPDASNKYTNYKTYQQPFEELLLHIHEIINITHYPPPENTSPPFIEEDKTLLMKPKSLSIVDLFSKVKKI